MSFYHKQHAVNNLQLLCEPCHLAKDAKTARATLSAELRTFLQKHSASQGRGNLFESLCRPPVPEADLKRFHDLLLSLDPF